MLVLVGFSRVFHVVFFVFQGLVGKLPSPTAAILQGELSEVGGHESLIPVIRVVWFLMGKFGEEFCIYIS